MLGVRLVRVKVWRRDYIFCLRVGWSDMWGGSRNEGGGVLGRVRGCI